MLLGVLPTDKCTLILLVSFELGFEMALKVVFELNILCRWRFLKIGQSRQLAGRGLEVHRTEYTSVVRLWDPDKLRLSGHLLNDSDELSCK